MIHITSYDAANKVIFLLLLLLTYRGAAHEGLVPEAGTLSFIENKGQWNDTVKYKAELPGGAVFITHQGFTYSFASTEDFQRLHDRWDKEGRNDTDSIRYHAYHVRFKGAKVPERYLTEGKRNYYHNYFIGNDPKRWQGNIALYEKVVQKNIYAGIDLVAYSHSSTFKYDFVVHPGAFPEAIVMEFEGVLPQLTKGGELQVTTTVNNVLEKAPYAYQVINDRALKIDCYYQLEGNQVRFITGAYNDSFPLIIDPELVFSTFSGSTGAIKLAYANTYDIYGNFYTAAVDWGSGGWPVTAGAFRQSSAGGDEIAINKYNASGDALLYATYFGGSGEDLAHALITTADEELIIAGSTRSPDIPMTTGSYDNSYNGARDLFFVRFNAAGTELTGATYLGGSLDDLYLNPVGSIGIMSPVEIALDQSGNIWIAGNTVSSDFPVTTNALQAANAGFADGIICQLNGDCSRLLYSSYIGGTGRDACFNVVINHEGKVVVCGATGSSDYPVTANRLHSTAPGGSYDGFVSIIDPVTGALVHSTYLGTGDFDQAYRLQVDALDNIYVLGKTEGQYPVSPGAYAIPNSDLFIDKLSPDLSQSLGSTRIGNQPGSASNGNPSAFLVDNCSNIYITRFRADEGLPLTPDAYDTRHKSLWLCVLEPDFEGLLYASYFGAGTIDHNHEAISRFDPKGIVYQSVCSDAASFPTTPNAVFPVKRNESVDNASFKLDFQLAGAIAGFQPAPGYNDSGCAPYTIRFQNTSSARADYTWNFGDGSPESNDTHALHTYTAPGTYTVSLYVHNSTACITDDTAYMTITVLEVNEPDITVTDTLICAPAEAVTLRVQVNNPGPYNTFLWEPTTGTVSGRNTQTITVNPALNDMYFITIWDTIPGICGLSVTDTVRLDYKPRALDILTNDTLICAGTSVPVQATATQGYTFTWQPSAGVDHPTALQPVITPLQTTGYTLTASYPGCRDTAQSLNIAVDNPVAVTFHADPDSICTGASISFLAGTDSTLTQFQWDFGDGNTHITTNERSIRHAYDHAGRMPVKLTAAFRACPDTAFTAQVHVFPFPHVRLMEDSALCLRGSPLYLKNLLAPPSVPHRYLWSTGDTTEVLKVLHPGIYTLSVTTEPIGCTTTENVTVTKDCYLDIPNAFSPNGDGYNDYFFPRALLGKSVSSFRLEVFNRWGQRVFLTTSKDGRGWDGRFNGKEQPAGAYVYSIDVFFANGQEEHYEGNVALIR